MTPPSTSTVPRSLAERLAGALRQGEAALAAVADAPPGDERDALLALMAIHDLHLAPIDVVGDAARWQHHPAIATLKTRLEADLVAWLEDGEEQQGGAGAVAAMRALARRDLVPPVYDWLAEEAGWDELVAYLALEGGPDADFDDMVAICQVGLAGGPKLELARNYWDEMGRGRLAEVHTELHRQLADAIAMPRIPRSDQPTAALRRTALGTLLATNRHLQPEMVGALGLLELQAGPRCRRVVRALERLGAPAGALPFYVEHAEVDPRHGKAWVDEVVAPLAEDPAWATGMVRGARWRSRVNAAFFTEAERLVRRQTVQRRAS